MQQQGLGGNPAPGGGMGGLPPGMVVPPHGSPRGPPAIHIQVTEQEKEAIERVRRFGRSLCIFINFFFNTIVKATWISRGVSYTGIFCM